MINDLWLLDLIDEYETRDGIPEPRINRLGAFYMDRDPLVMLVAVKTYIAGGGRYFPRIGELTKHVVKAQRLADGGQLFKGGAHDDLLWRVEVARGSVDPAAYAGVDNSARQMARDHGLAETDPVSLLLTVMDRFLAPV